MKHMQQELPVRMHRASGQLVITAPMPGLSPDEIDITITDRAALLRGEKHGENRSPDELLVDEWAVGPYHRELALPENVRGDLANATYGNGVLVLSLPTVAEPEEATRGSFQLRPVNATRGERVGHVGQAIHKTSTTEHQKKHR